MPNYGWVYQIRPRKPDIINKFYEDGMFIVVLFIDFILLIYVDIYMYIYPICIYIYIYSLETLWHSCTASAAKK